MARELDSGAVLTPYTRGDVSPLQYEFAHVYLATTADFDPRLIEDFPTMLKYFDLAGKNLSTCIITFGKYENMTEGLPNGQRNPEGTYVFIAQDENHRYEARLAAKYIMLLKSKASDDKSIQSAIFIPRPDIKGNHNFAYLSAGIEFEGEWHNHSPHLTRERPEYQAYVAILNCFITDLLQFLPQPRLRTS